MKPRLISVCSARRLALRLNPLRTLSTQSSVFEVSKQKMFFIHSIIDHRNDWIQMFSCRVWHFSVFDFLRGFVVVLLCRLPEQVILIHFYDFTNHYFIILTLFFLLYLKESSFFLLCWHWHWHNCFSHHPFLRSGPSFAKGEVFWQACEVQPSLVSCVTNVLFLFFCSTEKPFLFVPCWWLVIFCLCHPAHLQESQRNPAGTLACGLR